MLDLHPSSQHVWVKFLSVTPHSKNTLEKEIRLLWVHSEKAFGKDLSQSDHLNIYFNYYYYQ